MRKKSREDCFNLRAELFPPTGVSAEPSVGQVCVCSGFSCLIRIVSGKIRSLAGISRKEGSSRTPSGKESHFWGGFLVVARSYGLMHCSTLKRRLHCFSGIFFFFLFCSSFKESCSNKLQHKPFACASLQPKYLLLNQATSVGVSLWWICPHGNIEKWTSAFCVAPKSKQAESENRVKTQEALQ